MEDGLKQNLISERTFKINKRNLEKWVNSSYRKIDDNQRSRSQQPKSNTELIKESVEGMEAHMQAYEDEEALMQAYEEADPREAAGE